MRCPRGVAQARRFLGDAAAGDQRPFTRGAVGHAPPLAVLELLPRAGGAEQSLGVAQQPTETRSSAFSRG